MASERFQYVKRAEEAAKYTIPAIMPPNQTTAKMRNDDLYQPYQSVGARGVNTLSANLLISMFPPNQSFFRLVLDASAKAQFGDGQIMSEIDSKLSEIEQVVQKEIEVKAYRPAMHEAFRLLVVTGNALVHIDKEGEMRTFRLDNYVVRRRPNGKISKVILREEVFLDSLDPEIQAMVVQDASPNKTVHLFTCIYWDAMSKKYTVHQAVEDVVVPGSEATYTEDNLPFMALRWTRIQGEDYGRSFVEEHLGDVRSLEGLSQAILEASAASAKTLFLISPNGTTKARTLAQAGNGAIVQGDANDVSTLQVNKHADLSVALQSISMIKERLGKAFMITADLFRDAERVTATEIQAIIRQVEKSLGGLYSLLSNEFQLPLIRLILRSLATRKQIPNLPKEVSPAIVVGLDAIGRAAELEKLDMMLAGLGNMFGPEALGQYVNIGNYLERRAASLGVDISGLIKDEEQLAAEQQAAMAQQAAATMATEGASAAVQSAVQNQQQ